MKHYSTQIFRAICYICVVLAIGSCFASKNTLRSDSFDRSPNPTNYGNKSYILLNDGTKVYGNLVSWSGGLASNHEVEIDKKKYKIKDTKGYVQSGLFYHRVENKYAANFIAGKINVYYLEYGSYVPNASGGGGSHVTNYNYYAQKGIDGELVYLGKLKDLEPFIKDCALAMKVFNEGNKNPRKNNGKGNYYLNTAVEIYNNDCKE
jgi:hypothetical protein